MSQKYKLDGLNGEKHSELFVSSKYYYAAKYDLW